MSPSSSVQAFRKALHESKHIVVIAGAGLSAASGIPTFRDSNGLWKTYNAFEMATPRGFASNPSRVWQFYHMRRQAALRAQPNAAHYAIAMLAQPDQLHRIAPSAKTFAFVTQNVDGLSARAAQKLAETSTAIPFPMYEMHGKLMDTICTRCKHSQQDLSIDLTPELGKVPIEGPVIDLPITSLPHCKQAGCGGMLRPDVVWFEEMPKHLDAIDEHVQSADLCLVVGTSSTVYPAAGYADEVAQNGGKVAIFNLNHSQGDEEADFLFLGPCETTLPSMLDIEVSNSVQNTAAL